VRLPDTSTEPYFESVTTVAERPLAAAPAGFAAPELAGLRVLLVHEWLYTWAGAERCLEQLVALMPHADILAGIVTPEMRRRHEIARRATETWIGRIPGARAKHRWFLPLHPLALSAFDTSHYDLVISVSHAFEKTIRASKRAVHVSYCLTPPRYLWDLSASHIGLASLPQRIAFGVGAPVLRALDRFSARGVDHFVSLSHVVAERVRRSYGRESAVVYPPVSGKGGNREPGIGTRERFLLTLGRLVPYKRVDLAVRAAEQLKMRLVVAGDGPDRERLARLGGRNVEFVGEVSEEEAGRLMSTCAAFLFCAEEDFGIAPVEANAHGAPVVAFGRGGARETMVEGKTGTFFDRHTVDSLTEAIERCLATSWDERELRRNAERFSPDKFRDGMRHEIVRALGALVR
jgi:glycosyltransferase involved in cell wall biosynthesis